MKDKFILIAFFFCISLTAQEHNQPLNSIQESLDKTHQKESKQFLRMQHYARSHQSKRKINAQAENFKAYEEIMSRRDFTNAGNWSFMGPDSMTSLGARGLGRVNRVTFHPTNPQKLYASTAGGGLWYTSDGGQYWISLTDGLPILNTTGMVLNPVNTTKLFLLTGDGDGVGSFNSELGFTRTSLGVFKSLNGGLTWEKTGMNFLERRNPIQTYNIVMDPNDTAQIFVCSDAGLLHTNDEFETYDTLLNNHGAIYEMMYSPVYNDVAYAISQDSIFRSSDGGLTWSQSAYITDLDGEVERMSMDLQGNRLAILAGPVNSDTLIRGVFVGNDFNIGNIPQLVKMADSPNFFGGSGTTTDQSWYDNDIVINIENPFEIITAGVYMHKSIDGGATYSILNHNDKQYHADAHELRINPLDSALYACNDGGLYRSNDFGDTWSYLSAGMSFTQYYRTDVSPFNPEWVMGGAQDNGIHFRFDTVKTFVKVDHNDGMDVQYSPTDSLTMIGSTQFGRISLTTDGWTTDTVILNTGRDSASWLIPIAFDPTDDNIIYAGTNPILKSIDQGMSWTGITPDTVSGESFVEISPSNPNVIYAGEYVGGENNLMRSDDGGDSWEDITYNSNINDIRFSDLAINPIDSDEIWACLSGYEYANKVYYSEDGGDTWDYYWSGLPNVPMNAIVFLPPGNYPDGSKYVVCDIGVYYTNPDIGFWVPFFNGLPAVEVTDIAFDLINEDMIVATYGRGIWRSDMYGTCPDHLVLDNTNQKFWKRYNFRAGQTINSTAVVSGLGADVIYKAGDEIRLLDGFTLQGSKYATLKAMIGDCEVE